MEPHAASGNQPVRFELHVVPYFSRTAQQRGIPQHAHRHLGRRVVKRQAGGDKNAQSGDTQDRNQQPQVQGENHLIRSQHGNNPGHDNTQQQAGRQGSCCQHPGFSTVDPADLPAGGANGAQHTDVLVFPAQQAFHCGGNSNAGGQHQRCAQHNPQGNPAEKVPGAGITRVVVNRLTGFPADAVGVRIHVQFRRQGAVPDHLVKSNQRGVGQHTMNNLAAHFIGFLRGNQHGREPHSFLIQTHFQIGGLLIQDADQCKTLFFFLAVDRDHRQLQRIADGRLVHAQPDQRALFSGDFSRLFRHTALDQDPVHQLLSFFVIIAGADLAVLHGCVHCHVAESLEEPAIAQLVIRRTVVSQLKHIHPADALGHLFFMSADGSPGAQARGCGQENGQQDTDKKADIGFPVHPDIRPGNPA